MGGKFQVARGNAGGAVPTGNALVRVHERWTVESSFG